MNSTPRIVFHIVLYFVVGLEMAYIAIWYNAYKAQVKMLPRASFCVMALGFLLWGTGWVFQLYGFGVLETTFDAVGGVLLVINIPLMLMRRAARPTPPAS